MSWYRIGRDGVTIHIHVQTGAKRTEVAGLYGDCVKVRLASPPVDGKANESLIAFLAQRLGVKRAQVAITRGISSRRKSVFVAAVGLQPMALLGEAGEKN
ncbi:MAG: DUF167 domain-containing protein [Pseudomonadota bacterium]